MCGIHGFINGSAAHDNNSDDYIKQAFVANMLRGTDSSGMALVHAKGVYNHQKLPVNGMTFIQDNLVRKMATDLRGTSRAAICHVRHATVGGVSYANAHPFISEDTNGAVVIGVHNGTLTGWSGKPGAKDFNVDSEWAINHIMIEGVEAFKNFTGAYCFVWWDSDQADSICMARNKERPMHIAFTDRGNMAYASEAGMLHWIADRSNVKLEGNILSLEEGYLYTFPINNPKKYTKEALPEAKQPEPVVYSSRVYDSRTVVDKVKEVFASLNIPDPPKQFAISHRVSPQVSIAEFNEAENLGVIGEEGTFKPYGFDSNTGCLHGLFFSENWKASFDAEMRVADDVDSTEDVKVTVIGANTDDPVNVTLFVSHPVVELESVN